MRKFTPTDTFTLDQFESQYMPFRYKILSKNAIRLEYFNKCNPDFQYFRILATAAELELFRHTAAYLIPRTSPECDSAGDPTGYFNIIHPYYLPSSPRSFSSSSPHHHRAPRTNNHYNNKNKNRNTNTK